MGQFIITLGPAAIEAIAALAGAWVQTRWVRGSGSNSMKSKSKSERLTQCTRRTSVFARRRAVLEPVDRSAMEIGPSDRLLVQREQHIMRRTRPAHLGAKRPVRTVRVQLP